MRFPEAIDEIKSRLSILDVISERVSLKKSGKSYKGLCPFHVEKTPSFYVDPVKGVYHCFGCGASGNLFTFVMETEGLNFKDAVEYLAKKIGITIEYGSGADKRTPLLRILEFVSIYYVKQLEGSKGKVARDYLQSRSVNQETIEKFNLGYAPPSGVDLINESKKQGYDETLLTKAGLIMVSSDGRKYDMFRNRLMFPIMDTMGRSVAFGGRALSPSQTPKYLNSPETEVFKKGELVYGYPQSREAIRDMGYVFVVEGYMDVIMMHQAGYKNTVAPLGTALTEKQAKRLRKVTERAVLLFDGDEAGLNAIKRCIPTMLSAGLIPEIALLPEDTDPAQLVVDSPETLKKAIEKPLSVVDFYLKDVGDSTIERNKALSDLVVAIASANNPVAQEVYIQEASSKYGYDRSRINEAVKATNVKPSEIKPKNTNKETSSHWELKLVSLSMLDSETVEILCSLPDGIFIDPRASRAHRLLKETGSIDQTLAELDDITRELIIRWQVETDRLPPEHVKNWCQAKLRKKMLKAKVSEGPVGVDEDEFLKDVEKSKNIVIENKEKIKSRGEEVDE